MKTETKILSGAQIIVQERINQNVRTVFGYLGATVLPLFYEIYKKSELIQNVLTFVSLCWRICSYLR